MHDFDAAQRATQQQLLEEGGLTFTLRGEQFTIRRIIPFGVLKTLSDITNESEVAGVYQTIETAVLSLLASQDDRDRFTRVLYDTTSDFPITYNDILEINSWLIKEAARRPPTQPSPSSESPSQNGTDSTGSSSTEPEGA